MEKKRFQEPYILRELIKELAGAPFVFLGVMSDEKIHTVIESVDDKIITWRVWWDGDSKSISRRWNIQQWPKTYVIDKEGSFVSATFVETSSQAL